MPKLYTTDSVLTFTNDAGTDTLQGAVNAAITTKKPLFIAAGTFTFTSLNITGAVRIYGSKGATILKPPTGATVAAIINIQSSPAGNRINDVTIEGLQIQGLDLPITGHAWNNPLGLITAKLVDRLVVRDCFFSQSQGAGIQATACAGLVTNNEFWSCRTGIYDYKGLGMVMEANYIRDSKDNGIKIDRVDLVNGLVTTFEGAVVRANKIYTVDNATGGSGQFGNGIICTNANGVTVVDNIIMATKYSGIRLNACSTSIVSNNQIYWARETALFVESLGPDVNGYKGVTVSGNILDDVGAGISVVNPDAGARRVSVIGNSISNIKTASFTEWSSPDRNPANAYTQSTYAAGIMVAGSDVIVQGNTIEGKTMPDSAPRLGVFIYSTGDWNPATNTNRSQASVACIITDNLIKTCPVGIGYNDYDARGYAEISGNTIIGASAGSNVVRVNQDSSPLAGQSDIGATTTPVTNRYSFDRNKVVPLNS